MLATGSYTLVTPRVTLYVLVRHENSDYFADIWQGDEIECTLVPLQKKWYRFIEFMVHSNVPSHNKSPLFRNK